LAKLEVFDSEVRLRGQLGAAYSERLQDLVKTPYIEPHNTSVFAQYTIQVEDRQGFQERMQAAGVPTAVHYPVPLHLQPAFARPGLGRGSFPLAEAAADRVISLPMHPYLSQADQEKVVASVRAAIGAFRAVSPP
jgi:UDP-2-acetamido-2-deoxy-ribo-hexuluronate aminotransferase